MSSSTAEQRFGAWLVWDAADAPHDASAPSGTGLSIYWHQNGMEMLRDAILRGKSKRAISCTVPYREHVPYLLEPHAIDAVAGDPTLVTSFAKPLEHDGNVVGVIALDIKLDAIADTLAAIDIPKGASITIASDGGTVAMSTEKGLAGKLLRIAKPLLGVDPRRGQAQRRRLASLTRRERRRTVSDVVERNPLRRREKPVLVPGTF